MLSIVLVGLVALGGAPVAGISLDRFPYLASVRKVDQHVCTGALVHDRWVLVAAHCINDLYPKELTVVLGSKIGTVASVVMGIVDVRFPTTYSGSKTDGSNIALLKLESSSSVAPISLAEVEDARHGPGIRIGLGKGTVRDIDAPFELQENGVVPRVNCEDVWNLKMLLSMSCVSARINETCKGEKISGVLVVASSHKGRTMKGNPSQDALIGLLAVREDPCEAGTKPSIYTTVAPFQQWVESYFAELNGTTVQYAVQSSSSTTLSTDEAALFPPSPSPNEPSTASLSLQWDYAPQEESTP